MPREKTQEEIRRSALSMAVRMYRSGCVTCADSYLSVARSNGATESEVAAIRERMVPRRPSRGPAPSS